MLANRSTKKAASMIVVAVAKVAATLASGVKAASEDEVSVTEYITLPKFCWYQFSGGKVADANLGPESQVTNCGPHMNHYCYGLLDLQRSRKAKNVADRKMLLGRARTHTTYTLTGMKQDGTMTTCSITPHVEATMRAIELQMKIYNVK
jgi:hypothetical protein